MSITFTPSERSTPVMSTIEENKAPEKLERKDAMSPLRIRQALGVTLRIDPMANIEQLTPENKV